MKRRAIHAAVVVSAVLSGLVLAAGGKAPATPQPSEKPEGTRMKIYGDVKVAKDKEAALTGITVVSISGVTYNVVLDEIGKKLAAMDRKRVAVLGYVTGEGYTRTIKVEKFELPGKSDKKKPASPKPKPKPKKTTKKTR